MQTKNFEKVDVTGVSPAARFGHTITYIAKGRAILFGGVEIMCIYWLGATGDTGRYSITGDTYSLDQGSRVWKKIDGIIQKQCSEWFCSLTKSGPFGC